MSSWTFVSFVCRVVLNWHLLNCEWSSWRGLASWVWRSARECLGFPHLPNLSTPYTLIAPGAAAAADTSHLFFVRNKGVRSWVVQISRGNNYRTPNIACRVKRRNSKMLFVGSFARGRVAAWFKRMDSSQWTKKIKPHWKWKKNKGIWVMIRWGFKCNPHKVFEAWT